MRLYEDTADIPDELIALQEKGEVIFLCGAGVSQRYDLPSFFKLTEDIYSYLGLSWEGYPAEEDGMGINKDGERKGPAALDRRYLLYLSASEELMLPLRSAPRRG